LTFSEHVFLICFHYFFVFLLFSLSPSLSTQGLTILPRLTLNSWSSCLSLPHAGIIGIPNILSLFSISILGFSGLGHAKQVLVPLSTLRLITFFFLFWG
jgi:hypothetical protein